MDCYGSLADTSVAEDGYLKEHSYRGTLFGMKMSALFTSWFGCAGNTERMRERERDAPSWTMERRMGGIG